MNGGHGRDGHGSCGGYQWAWWILYRIDVWGEWTGMGMVVMVGQQCS